MNVLNYYVKYSFASMKIMIDLRKNGFYYIFFKNLADEFKRNNNFEMKLCTNEFPGLAMIDYIIINYVVCMYYIILLVFSK